MTGLRCASLLVLVSLLAIPSAQAQGTAKKAKQADDPFFSGPPFSRDDILQRVGVIADRRLRAAILHRGINFSPSQADYDKLKQAGATPELLQVIAVKAPPPAKPAAPANAGALTLQCAPAECNISVNGKPHGTTSKGVMQLRDLPAAETVIDFMKDGFEGQQISIALRPGAAASRSATLKPTAATLAQAGKDLLSKIIEKLGGAEALQAASLVSAAGNASLWQSGGQRTEWRMIARIKVPSLALIEINGAGLKWWTSLAGSDSKADGSKQMKGGPVAVEMEKLVRFYRDYQPAMLASRLGKMTLTAPEGVTEAPGASRLRGTDADGSLTVLLNPDFTPVRVIYESASGLGSGLEILYTDYVTIGKAYYPKAMTIKFADQPQHGLEVHLDEVKFETKLAPREFHR